MSYQTAAFLIGFLLLCLFHAKMYQAIADHEDLRQRYQRFLATMISKKIFAWGVVTAMFIYDTYIEVNGQFQYWEYLTFTCAVFAIDVSQKFAGLKGGQ